MAENIFADDEVHELRLGRSFDPDGKFAFHSMYYDFKPASIDTTQPAKIEIEEGNKVKVTLPHVENCSTPETVYCGSKQPMQKDYALIIDNKTGVITLEKLSYKLNLKRTRPAKPKPPPTVPTKKSKLESTNATVAAPTPGSTPKSGAPSPSLPDGLANGPSRSSSSTAAAVSSASKASNDLSASSSSSSDGESSSNGSSDSSDSEEDAPMPTAATHPTSQTTSSRVSDNTKPAPAANSHAQKLTGSGFSVCQDLELSDSDSDSD